MKKLLILIIVLACMGCSNKCEEANVFGTTVITCNYPIDFVPEDACDWGREWDDCTCQCEWFWN